MKIQLKPPQKMNNLESQSGGKEKTVNKQFIFPRIWISRINTTFNTTMHFTHYIS